MDISQIILVSMTILGAIAVPGIFISLAIFPKKEQFGGVERAGLAFLLGLIPSLTLYFLAKNFSIPIDSFTAPAAIVLLTVLGAAIWQFRIRT